jgi:hypothetical protein
MKVKLADLHPQQQGWVLWDKARRWNNVAPALTVDAVAGGTAQAPLPFVFGSSLH